MKKGLIILVAVVVMATMASALDWDVCLRFLNQNANPETAWELRSHAGTTHIHKWNLEGPKPTAAALQPVEADALAWSEGKRKADRAATLVSVPLVRALLVCLNRKFPADNPITEQELIEALKAEL